MADTRIKRLVVYLPADLHEWVRVEAHRQRRSMSNLVETVLRDLAQQGGRSDG